MPRPPRTTPQDDHVNLVSIHPRNCAPKHLPVAAAAEYLGYSASYVRAELARCNGNWHVDNTPDGPAYVYFTPRQPKPMAIKEVTVYPGQANWMFDIIFEGEIVGSCKGLEPLARRLSMGTKATLLALQKNGFELPGQCVVKKRLSDVTFKRQPFPTRNVYIGGKKLGRPSRNDVDRSGDYEHNTVPADPTAANKLKRISR